LWGAVKKRRFQRPVASFWDDVDDPVTTSFEFVKEGGQHLGSLRLGIVKQDDAATGAFDAGQNKAQLLIRSHRKPVACPDIGPENHETPFRHAIQERAVGGKTRENERRAS